MTPEQRRLLREAAGTSALTLMLVALWSATHRYKGITGDAELYAVQAVARFQPGLSSDVFLQYTSQDRFTIFSPIYASFIAAVGLHNAALSLTLVCAMWYFAAAWSLARAVSGRTAAFAAVALLIIAAGGYGANGVFHYSEDWLTARSLGEALVATSLACFLWGKRSIALLFAAVAVSVHPIMALPGLLTIVLLWLPIRAGAIAAGAGILTALGIAVAGIHHPSTSGLLELMDPDWLAIVRERSQFLFLQLWPAAAWVDNAGPFLCLTIGALALRDERARRFCIATILVGITGVVIGFIASTLGPVALLLQGQAWRWVWLTGFASVIMLVPIVLELFRDERCGPICAALLIGASTFTVADGTAGAALALFIWLLRERIDVRTARMLRCAAVVIGVVMLCGAIAGSWTVATSTAAETGHEALALSRLRSILGHQVPVVALVWFLTRLILAAQSVLILALISAAFLIGAAVVIPDSLNDSGRDGTAGLVAEFADWRATIPLTSNVYVVPAHNSAAFAWFTLQRPSYLSVDQSAGVVFSRATALEIRRRSQVLLPMMDPDWRLLSARLSKAGAKPKDTPLYRPLTKERLVSICEDERLGFVVAKEHVGFAPLSHTHAGRWKDWNLYDCRRARAPTPAP